MVLDSFCLCTLLLSLWQSDNVLLILSFFFLAIQEFFPLGLFLWSLLGGGVGSIVGNSMEWIQMKRKGK